MTFSGVVCENMAKVEITNDLAIWVIRLQLVSVADANEEINTTPTEKGTIH